MDRVPALAQYRGKCQPVFLFYADGRLVEAVEGVNGPRLTQLVVGLTKKK